MNWHKAHSSFIQDPLKKPVIDRCINSGQAKEIKTTITMEFGSGNFHRDPICRDCYRVNHGPGIKSFQRNQP